MNNRYILKLWLIPILIAVIMVIALLASPNENLIPILIGVGGSIFIYFNRKKWAGYKIELLFRTAGLDELLQYYDRKINTRMLPEGEFSKSYMKALTMSLFGEFERAHREMDPYDMTYKAPLHRAMQMNATAVNNYLQKKDLSFSLELSKQAKEIAYVNKMVPGRVAAENAHDSYIEIGEVLTGNLNENIIRQLEERFPSALFLIKIQIAWALAIAYKKSNRVTDCEAMKSYLNENAPRCKPLFNFS